MLTQNRANTRAEGQAYRAFSRQRYSQLKNQLKHLRESEIVARVIREWEQMNPDQKNKLASGEATILDLNPMATPLKDKMARTNQKTTVEKKQEKSENSSINLDEINVKEFDECEPNKLNKSKQISKCRSEYLSFFKHYFNKLSQEHKRWNARQLTHVIKLLWRKRKTVEKGSKTRSMRLTKPISGFRTYRKTMSLNAQEARMRWTQMPYEGRVHWEKRGDPSKAAKNMPMEMRGSMKFSSMMTNSSHNMDFMRSRMM